VNPLAEEYREPQVAPDSEMSAALLVNGSPDSWLVEGVQRKPPLFRRPN
jgi:hypothetical protein